MGEKKKKEASQKKWTKVIFIFAAVLFAFAMVGSYLPNLITGLAPVKPGDSAVIDYTIYDAAGSPLVTSNQQLYTQAAKAGSGIMYSKQLTLTANQSLNTGTFPVPVYIGSNGGSWQQFALFSPEYDAITAGLVGMRVNDKKTIALTANNTMTQMWSPEQLAKNNINMSEIQVGETLAMGVSDNPNATAENATATTYIRIGQVTRITPAGVVVDFGYPRADIRFFYSAVPILFFSAPSIPCHGTASTLFFPARLYGLHGTGADQCGNGKEPRACDRRDRCHKRTRIYRAIPSEGNTHDPCPCRWHCKRAI